MYYLSDFCDYLRKREGSFNNSLVEPYNHDIAKSNNTYIVKFLLSFKALNT